MTTTNQLDRRDHLLGVGAPLFYEDPVHIVRGEGAWLYDADGKQYLDMYNNVPCVGHCHPHVVEAMHKQASTLNVHCRYLHDGILDYAERLANLHADPLTSSIFTCTGTEANEVALAVARAVTGGHGIICTDSTYHGNSSEINKFSRTRNLPSGPAADVRAIPFPELYRPIQDGVPEAELTELYLDQVQQAIDSFAASAIPFAGMLVCSILANEGLPDVPPNFLPMAAELVRKNGGLFIADEVQSGFCRTGKWWGYEVFDFEPDIVTMGKPMGNGLPLAGMITSAENLNTFRSQRGYFNTFASSPLQAAVGMAVIDVIENENLRQNVEEVGRYLRTELHRLQETVEPIGDVRGHGLFIAVEWVSDRNTKEPDQAGAVRIVNLLKEKGVLISNAGAYRNVLKIRPPLVFSREQADIFLATFTEVTKQ